MSSILAVGQALHAELSGLPCVVHAFLGAGGQGEVYRAQLGGADLALKWYYTETATAEQRAALETLVRKGSPSEVFLWPLDLVVAPGVPGFGYLMPLRPDRFKSGNGLCKCEFQLSFSSAITLAMNLVSAFLQLHAKGFAYRDINFGNFFLVPETGEVLICDLDNVGIDGHPHNEVAGAMKFMAPEIVRGEVYPSSRTDLYSLAVLLHFIFFMSHPLEGKREAMIGCVEPSDEYALYGQAPVYIADPQDISNRPMRGRHDNMLAFWPIYPSFFKKLFLRAFCEGLKDPAGRVKETEWRAALAQLRDCLIYCGECGRENFWGREHGTASSKVAACWYEKCKKPLAAPVILVIEKQQIMLNHDSRVFPHHIDKDRLYDFSQPVAEVNQHPQKPHVWGLKNVSNDLWKVTLSDGKVLEVGCGKSVTLAPGTLICFGETEGKVQWEEGK